MSIREEDVKRDYGLKEKIQNLKKMSLQMQMHLLVAASQLSQAAVVPALQSNRRFFTSKISSRYACDTKFRWESLKPQAEDKLATLDVDTIEVKSNVCDMIMVTGST